MRSTPARIVALTAFACLGGSPLLAQVTRCAGYETANLSPDSQVTAAAIDGDVLVLGAPRDPSQGSLAGAAFVYRYQGMDWVLEQMLVPGAATSLDRTGKSVAVSGEVIVVGGASDNCTDAAYVFRFDGSSWIEEQTLVPSVAATCSRFGVAVAISGSTILVGAERDDHVPMGSEAGSVFAYRYDGSQWIEEAILLPTLPEQDKNFGHSLVLRDDLAVIGAPGPINNGCCSPGAVYTFRRAGPGAWSEEQKIEASDGHIDDAFGWSIALDGDRLAVGAFRHKVNGNIRGAAYVYRNVAGTWGSEEQLLVEPEGGQLALGYAVALGDDKLAVGAPRQPSPSPLSGTVYLYKRSGQQWEHDLELRGSNASNSTLLGGALAAQRQHLVAGSEDSGSATFGAYAFDLGALPRCPTEYCVGSASSAGCIPTIGFYGSASVSSPGAFIITASETPNRRRGLLAYGFGPASIPFLGGTLCVAPPLQRSALSFSNGSAPPADDCSGFFAFDMNGLIQSGSHPALGVGTTVNAQVFFFDRPFSGTAPRIQEFQRLSGMTNALQFVINP